ncbi:MAG: hypothetical protein JWM31_2296, partial [Solirubrobacterales bacterium]|nr:hypothetical protein [Solirubrobacterales bacterium]
SSRRAAAAGAAAVGVLAATGVACAIAVDVHEPYQRDDYRAAVAAAVRDPVGPRLVYTDGGGRVPGTLYLGRGTHVVLPGVPQTVREIDVLRVAGAEPGRPRSTPSIRADITPAGFALAGVAQGSTWAVRRYVATTPTVVDPASLSLFGLGPRAVVLLRPR